MHDLFESFKAASVSILPPTWFDLISYFFLLLNVCHVFLDTTFELHSLFHNVPCALKQMLKKITLSFSFKIFFEYLWQLYSFGSNLQYLI